MGRGVMWRGSRGLRLDYGPASGGRGAGARFGGSGGSGRAFAFQLVQFHPSANMLVQYTSQTAAQDMPPAGPTHSMNRPGFPGDSVYWEPATMAGVDRA